MSTSNYCFLTCTRVSQVAGKVVWYSHFFKNFPQFVVTHTNQSILKEINPEYSLEGVMLKLKH